MKKTAKAKGIIKLLKQGYSPREITQRMDASYNYAWTLQKELAQEKAAAKAAAKAAKETILSVDDTIHPNIHPNPENLGKAQSVDTILDARSFNYGSFLGLSKVTQRLKAVAHNFAADNNQSFDADQAEALDMIFTKIGRILNGDPNHTDSWIDIAGYATLVANRLEGKVR